MGWLTEHLGRKLPPFPDAEPDWQVGDRAECISKDGWVSLACGEKRHGPEYCQILRVAEVDRGYGTIWLAFVECGAAGYPAGAFRKIRPARDVEWLQRARGKRDLVPA